MENQMDKKHLSSFLWGGFTTKFSEVVENREVFVGSRVRNISELLYGKRPGRVNEVKKIRKNTST